MSPRSPFVVCCAAIALAWRHRILATVFAVLALIQVAPVIRYDGSNPVHNDPRAIGRLHILMANVMWLNLDHARLAELIEAERPDIESWR